MAKFIVEITEKGPKVHTPDGVTNLDMLKAITGLTDSVMSVCDDKEQMAIHQLLLIHLLDIAKRKAKGESLRGKAFNTSLYFETLREGGKL